MTSRVMKIDNAEHLMTIFIFQKPREKSSHLTVVCMVIYALLQKLLGLDLHPSSWGRCFCFCTCDLASGSPRLYSWRWRTIGIFVNWIAEVILQRCCHFSDKGGIINKNTWAYSSLKDVVFRKLKWKCFLKTINWVPTTFKGKTYLYNSACWCATWTQWGIHNDTCHLRSHSRVRKPVQIHCTHSHLRMTRNGKTRTWGKWIIFLTLRTPTMLSSTPNRQNNAFFLFFKPLKELYVIFHLHTWTDYCLK